MFLEIMKYNPKFANKNIGRANSLQLSWLSLKIKVYKG